MKTTKGLSILCIVLAVCLVVSVGVYIPINVAYQDAKNIESPYVAPAKFNIYAQYPDWDPSQGDPPDDSHGHPFSMTAYPEHWTVGERVDWLLNQYNFFYIVRSIMHDEEFFADEENLREVAWFEAELEFLDSLQTPILEDWGIDREDYLVRK